MQSNINSIEQAIKMLARLPGFGPRSARRSLLHLLQNKETSLAPLIDALKDVHDTISECENCYNLDIFDICQICQDNRRDQQKICVVENVSDLWALEQSNIYNGLYHVLGGVLSAMDGMGPDNLNLNSLLIRCKEYMNKTAQGTPVSDELEIILATNLTIEGQTTAHYIADMLQDMPIKITRLAHGVPAGGELDYLDEGTLSAALQQRKKF